MASAAESKNADFSYPRKRFLNDITLMKNGRNALQRSKSLENISGSVSDKKLKNAKEVYKITSEMIQFKNEAMQTLKNLIMYTEDIYPFHDTKNGCVNYLHSLDYDLHWTTQHQIVTNKFQELKTRHPVETPSDHAITELDDLEYDVVQSLDEMDIPQSCLIKMMACLDNSEKPNKLKLLRKSEDVKTNNSTVECGSSGSSVLSILGPDSVLSEKLMNADEIMPSGSPNKIEITQEEKTESQVDIIFQEEMNELNEIPDNDSLSSADIGSLRQSSGGSIIIPKSKVLRMTYEDSQENRHVVSKHYIQTDDCYVKISLQERLEVDKFIRKTKKQKRSSTDESSVTSSSTTSSQGLNRRKSTRKTGWKRRKISTSSSSLWSSSSDEDPSFSSFTNSSSDTNDRMSYTRDSSSSNESDIHTRFDSSKRPNVLDQISSTSDTDSSFSTNSCDSKDTKLKKITIKKSSKSSTPYSLKTKHPKPAWMKDPLLKPLAISSLSDDDKDNVARICDSNEEDDESLEAKDDKPEKGMAEKGDAKNKKLRLKKRRIIETDDENENDEISTNSMNKLLIVDSDSDGSDIEFVSYQSRIKTENEDSSAATNNRRNIREILSEANLNVATLAVQEEEKKRVERFEARQSQSQQILTQTSSITSLESDFILDANQHQPIAVHAKLAQRLYPHQRKGVQFLWDNCYESVERLKDGDKGAGCILAHCMGLGKTFQVVTLIHTLFKHPVTKTKTVLIISPLSVISTWKQEFKNAGKLVKHKPNIRVYDAGANNFDAKVESLRIWSISGGVMIIGYDAFVAITNRASEVIGDHVTKSLLKPGPDLVVCDEGHLLKVCKSARSMALRQITTKRKIILTGTPMQNNLNEYYCMIGYVKPNFLGNKKEFNNRFKNPITNGQCADSTPRDIRVMKHRSHVLHKMTKHFIQRFEESELSNQLPKMYDYVIKFKISDLQITLVKKFLDLCNKRNPFANLAVIREICTHPFMLHHKMKRKEQMKKKSKTKQTDELEELKELKELLAIDPNWWKPEVPTSCETDITLGPKLVIMMAIVKETLLLNEKLLIFSLSLTELDVIEKFLMQNYPSWRHGKTYCRIDGSVETQTRVRYCNQFNEAGGQIKLLLLSHKVGGVGLNLHAANRAIIMDTSWNPADDLQAVFRIYRIGQEKTCFVYRLIAMGTMEEVIYERSVNKQAIAGRVVDEMQISRHFTASDLDSMYRCNLDGLGERPMPKIPFDRLLATLLQRLTCIYSYQDHKELLQNLPEEELDEAEMKLAWEEYEKEKNFTGMRVPVGNVSGMFTDEATRNQGRADQTVQVQPSTSGVNAGTRVNDSEPFMTYLMEKFRNESEIEYYIFLSISINPKKILTSDNLKGKNIFFVNKLGQKILAKYDNGKVINNLQTDLIVQKQVVVAESLLYLPPLCLTGGYYMIMASGNLINLDLYRTNSVNLNKSQPSQIPETPNVTTDLTNDDVQVIEVL